MLSVAVVASATSAASTMPAAPAAPTMSAAPAASASAALTLRAGFIDHQGTPQKFLSVESRDGFFRFGIILKLGKAKSPRLPGETVAQESEQIRLSTYLCKQGLHLFLCRFEREISHVKFLQGKTPCGPACGGRFAKLKEAGIRPRAVMGTTGHSRLK